MNNCDNCTGGACMKAHDCETCRFNANIHHSSGRIVGPCGQQNCWYGSVVCRYNGYSMWEGEEGNETV